MFIFHWAFCSHMKKKKKKKRRKRCSHFRFIHTFPSDSRRSFIPSETLFPPHLAPASDPAVWSRPHGSPPRQYQSANLLYSSSSLNTPNRFPFEHQSACSTSTCLREYYFTNASTCCFEFKKVHFGIFARLLCLEYKLYVVWQVKRWTCVLSNGQQGAILCKLMRKLPCFSLHLWPPWTVS